MRYQSENSTPGFFAGDLPDGDMLIECQSCKTEVISSEDWGEPLVCTGCQKEIHYPKGAEW